jgi:hypothetical protein
MAIIDENLVLFLTGRYKFQEYYKYIRVLFALTPWYHHDDENFHGEVADLQLIDEDGKPMRLMEHGMEKRVFDVVRIGRRTCKSNIVIGHYYIIVKVWFGEQGGFSFELKEVTFPLPKPIWPPDAPFRPYWQPKSISTSTTSPQSPEAANTAIPREQIVKMLRDIIKKRDDPVPLLCLVDLLEGPEPDLIID